MMPATMVRRGYVTTGAATRPLVAVFVAACSAETPRVTADRVGDTIVVESRHPSRADTASLELVHRIGTFDGTEENEFQSIRAFTVHADGRVFAFDTGAGIKEFDPSGEFTRWIARIGEGPDEVGCAIHLAAHQDRLAAHDPCNARIAVFGLESEEVVQSIRQPDGMPRYGEDGLLFDSDGALWVGIVSTPPADGDSAYPRPIAVRVTRDGDFADTVYVPARYGERCPITSEPRYRAGFWEDKREQWYPKVKWAFAGPGSFAVGCPRSFELDVMRKDRTVLRIRKPWSPAATTADEREFYEEWWKPIPPLPELKPAYARIILTPEGEIWVWPEHASEPLPYNAESRQLTDRSHGWQPATQGAFEVFAADGEWLGRVRVPASVEYSGYPTTEPIVIRGDTVWAVMRDSLDVPYIGRFLVRWSR